MFAGFQLFRFGEQTNSETPATDPPPQALHDADLRAAELDGAAPGRRLGGEFQDWSAQSKPRKVKLEELQLSRSVLGAFLFGAWSLWDLRNGSALSFFWATA